MSVRLSSCFPLALTLASLSPIASAQVDITAIFGSGNPDSGWSEGVSSDGGVQVALRGKNRDTGDTPWSAGNVYTFSGGPAANPSRSSVQWEFSINSDFASTGTMFLDDYLYRISVDTDPTIATSFIQYSAFLYSDNSLGTSATLNGAGLEDNLLTGRTIAQNSQNLTFFPFPSDPNISGIFDITLEAASLTDTGFSDPLASVTIRLVVGNVTYPPVPEPSTYGVMGAGALVGLIALRRRRAVRAA